MKTQMSHVFFAKPEIGALWTLRRAASAENYIKLSERARSSSYNRAVNVSRQQGASQTRSRAPSRASRARLDASNARGARCSRRLSGVRLRRVLRVRRWEADDFRPIGATAGRRDGATSPRRRDARRDHATRVVHISRASRRSRGTVVAVLSANRRRPVPAFSRLLGFSLVDFLAGALLTPALSPARSSDARILPHRSFHHARPP